MAISTTGRFVWHELHTNDRPKAVKFYTRLIGWETKDVQMGPGEPYSLVLLNGKDHAGITKSMAPPGVPPHWLAYLAVEDVDAYAKKVTQLGGKVMAPPMDIPDVGRFAVVTDPEGAAFAIHKHGTPYPTEPEMPPAGSFCWEELYANDPAKSSKFYGDLFGYTIEPVDMGPMGTYYMLKRGTQGTGGIMKIMPGMPPHSHWLTYLAVRDVNASTRHAEDLGGKVLRAPTEIPNIGSFSILQDPTGAAVALFQGLEKPAQK